MEEMQAEKDKIQAEKAENAKMLEELKALKAQLEGQKAAETEPEPVSEEPVSEEPASEETAVSEESVSEAPASEESDAKAE